MKHINRAEKHSGRPRTHPHQQAIGQLAIDAEWQDIADERSEALATRSQYGSMNALTTTIDEADNVNSKFAAIILATREIAKDANNDDIDSLYSCLERYINFCIEHNVRITNSGAYAACGLNRNIIKEWAHGMTRASTPEYKQFALFIRNICDEYREMLMAENKIHPVVGIWWQKNYDGFRDQPNEAEVRDDDTDRLTAAEIAEKYANLDD